MADLRDPVLVVDDRAVSREHLALALQARGFATVEACDGVEGLDVFLRHRPAAVVTDMRMPRADGFDLVERVRARADVPIFCVTAYPEWDAALLAMRKGATYYYRWPADFDRLLEDVHATLAGDPPARPPVPAPLPFRSLETVRARGRDEEAEERRARLENALRATRGNVGQAAELLRVSRRTLYNWMDRYGVRRSER